MSLNGGQQLALKLLITWWRHKTSKVFQISGAAGTGKTYIVRKLIEAIGLDLSNVLFMAYIGKASLAMVQNGLPGKTIHSAICDTELETQKDCFGNVVKREDGSPVIIPLFKPKPSLPEHIKLLVVDEGAMVPEKLGKWILGYNIPTIVLGDLNQLPPVFGKPFFLRNPDVILTEIMRQSKDSPIPWLANKILQGSLPKYGNYKDIISIVHSSDITVDDMLESNIVICGRNKTRWYLNHDMRRRTFNIPPNEENPKEPLIGDKLICRKNNWIVKIRDTEISLINGMIGEVKDIIYELSSKQFTTIDFKPEITDKLFFNVPVDLSHFRNYITSNSGVPKRSLYESFELGYAITCHLAQGSQYDNVMVMYEVMGNRDYQRQWLYTAVTRAKKKLTIVY